MGDPWPYVCPCCRGRLRSDASGYRCDVCGTSYPVNDGVADFCRGDYYDRFEPGRDRLNDDHLRSLEDERTGTVARIADYYLPRLRALGGTMSAAAPLRVLDCGCGNGLSVDLLGEAGFDAWGNDPSQLRRWQWRERTRRHRLAAAGGAALPFEDDFFDAVICSGVLEHIGVVESAGPPYRVAPLPERDELRRRFLLELLRVTSGRGRLWLDVPNGAFPIDFWHTTEGRGMRWHSPREGFLPTAAEVRRLVRTADGTARTVRALPPRGRLHYQRVRRHWFGRAFLVPAKLLLRAMELPVLRRLAASSFNPYLVLEISQS